MFNSVTLAIDSKSLSRVIGASAPFATATPTIRTSNALTEIPRVRSLHMISLDFSTEAPSRSNILMSEKNLLNNLSSAYEPGLLAADYTTHHKRISKQNLGIDIPENDAVVAVDSTGIKVTNRGRLDARETWNATKRMA
jgi:hypothetical protein